MEEAPSSFLNYPCNLCRGLFVTDHDRMTVHSFSLIILKLLKWRINSVSIAAGTKHKPKLGLLIFKAHLFVHPADKL
jgi:hypothetical protein